MSELAAPEKKAWQPFTPSGVARFAYSSLNRLLAIQIAISLLVAGSVIWFLSDCYNPVLLSAIQELPEKAEISKQKLQGVSPRVLAENRFLSIATEQNGVDVAGVGDLQIRFAPSALRACSLLGCVEYPYPEGWIISLSRSTLEPAWGAWKPMILGAIALLTAVGLLISWAVFATVYMFLPRMLAFYWDREITWRGSWKLAGAAQMFGALFVVLGIICYGTHLVDLLRFMILYVLHFPITWILLIVAPRFLPRIPDAPPSNNPFTSSEQPTP